MAKGGLATRWVPSRILSAKRIAIRLPQGRGHRSKILYPASQGQGLISVRPPTHSVSTTNGPIDLIIEVTANWPPLGQLTTSREPPRHKKSATPLSSKLWRSLGAERRNVDTKHSPPRNHGFPHKYPTTVLQIVSEEEHRCSGLIDIHGTGARRPPWRKHISAAKPIRWDGKHISAARPHKAGGTAMAR
jgi:hypothetical protein